MNNFFVYTRKYLSSNDVTFLKGFDQDNKTKWFRVDVATPNSFAYSPIGQVYLGELLANRPNEVLEQVVIEKTNESGVVALVVDHVIVAESAVDFPGNLESLSCYAVTTNATFVDTDYVIEHMEIPAVFLDPFEVAQALQLPDTYEIQVHEINDYEMLQTDAFIEILKDVASGALTGNKDKAEKYMSHLVTTALQERQNAQGMISADKVAEMCGVPVEEIILELECFQEQREAEHDQTVNELEKLYMENNDAN